jgi:hypothetical protein
MKTVLIPLLSLLCLALAPLRAADDTRTANVKAADDDRVAAVLAGARARLTAILSDELHYAHSSGAVDTKTSYIEALTSGKTKYTAWNYEERNFTFPRPGVALMTGRAKVTVGSGEMVLGFLGVYREEDGKWRFLAWQSCKLPASGEKK